MAWPPTLEQLKDDLAIPVEDTEDDAALGRRLSAAVAMVQRTRADAFATDELTGEPVDPAEYSTVGEREADSLELGTLMLAARWHARRRSPDLVLWMSETGTVRIPAMDDDTARLLRLGRHKKPRVG